MRHPSPALLAPVLAVLLGASACGTGTAPDDTAAPAATTPPASSAPATAAPAPSATPEGTAVEVAYAGGEVSGDTGRVEVGVGEPVRLTVTSDVVEEVHVHGPDLYVDLVPGQPATSTFSFDAPGVYEVELHDAGTVLTRVQVE